MEIGRFARLTRLAATLSSRRDLARVFGIAALAFPRVTEAKHKHKHHHRHKPKPHVIFNDFGCVDVGGFCQTSDQCCSGICADDAGKRACAAHDTGNCQPGQDACSGTNVACLTGMGQTGACVRTTGNAPYCGQGGACFGCAKDVDCQDFCGREAACIVCESLCGPQGTICIGPSHDSCDFGL